MVLQSISKRVYCTGGGLGGDAINALHVMVSAEGLASDGPPHAAATRHGLSVALSDWRHFVFFGMELRKGSQWRMCV